MAYTINDVQQALELSNFDGLAAQKKMMPRPRPVRRPPEKSGQARVGGVLLLLYCRDEQLHLLLTRRRDDLQSHAGQISFPGGRHEPPETLQMTALRETHEEVGIPPTSLAILGKLSTLYILPSDFEVHPFVGWYKNGKQPNFTPHSREVAEVIEAPLDAFFDPATRAEEQRVIRGYDIIVPYFAVGEHKVWGATAMMLSEFLERLQAIEKSNKGSATADPRDR